jgi:hypothetical protein
VSFLRSFEDFTPPKRFDGNPFTEARIYESGTRDGTYALIEAVALDPVDADPAAPVSRDFSTDGAALDKGWYRIDWADAADAVAQSTPLYVPTPTFAEVGDVGRRLGRDLTSDEFAAAELVIELVTGLIVEFLEEDAEWAAALDPVPSLFRTLCITKAVDALANPENLAAMSETLGAYSHSETFPRSEDGVDICLTDYERKQILRLRRGGSFQSVTLESPYSGDSGDDEPGLVL